MTDAEKQTEEELLQEAEDLYQQLLGSLPTRVECKPITVPKNERIPFKAHIAKAGLIYRVVDFTRTTLDLVKKKRPTPAFVLIRCVFETTAVLFLLYQYLERVVKDKKVGDINDFLNRIVAGSRSEFTPKAPDGNVIKSIHISKAIDKLSKEFNKYLAKEYGFICEFAHPNFLGTVGSYGKLDKERDFYDFSLDASYENIPEPCGYGLFMLVTSLEVFTFYYKKIKDILPKFTEICEAEAKNSKDEEKQ